MTTRELRNKLRTAQLSAGGSRRELEERYNEFRKKTLAEADLSSSEDEDEDEDQQEETHPAIVMLDEETGNRYMRIVDQKGLGAKGDMRWLIQDMHEELKSWGRPGGPNQQVTLKSDGEPAIIAVREALANIHGGMVTPE